VVKFYGKLGFKIIFYVLNIIISKLAITVQVKVGMK